jgi:DNA primase
MIPKSFTDNLLKKIRLEDLVSEYAELVPIGQQYRGACPFHDDKNSFNVSADKQIWKCFKCNRGGNAISFIMEIQKKSFPLAARFLCERLKIEMPDPD